MPILCQIFLIRGRGECNVTQLSHVPIIYCGDFVKIKTEIKKIQLQDTDNHI